MIVLDYREDKELFNKTALKWAEMIFEDKEYIEKERKGRVEKNFKKDPIKTTQMRKFYDQILLKYNEVKIEKKEFDEVLPFIKMINSKVEYAYNRELISKSFRKMMITSIEQIENEKKLENFKLFFEAVIGFYKGSK